MDEGQRVLCQIETKESLSSIKSGLANLIQCAKDFKNTALENHLVAIQNEGETNTDNALEVKIHQSCRKTMSNDHEVKKHGAPSTKKARYDWKANCMFRDINCVFCGKTYTADEKDPEREKDVHLQSTRSIETLSLISVKGEMMNEYVSSNIVSEAVPTCRSLLSQYVSHLNVTMYLSYLYVNLKAKRKTMAQGMKGRPSKDSDGFETLREWMETEGDLYTLDELRTQLQLIMESEDVYCTRSIKCKLQEKYGENISFNEVRG